MLDAQGEALERALGRNLFMIKPNWRELDALVGAERELDDPGRREDAARLVAEGRAQVVVVTEGAARRLRRLRRGQLRGAGRRRSR